ncbi:glycosyltransferase 87 family protein [Sphingomonas sp. PAMC 26605]|uniref:glycosyltransferase 87 family protein n=1 Tax=Sphingomonas sp. PAMC 26605 TaxID=1112214 RepID=UPI00026CAD0E|nr:glycosyltransferase 87 family protein [Sphingomonas sp. PAMC 26605]
MSGKVFLGIVAGSASLLIALAGLGAWGLLFNSEPKVVGIMIATAFPFTLSAWFVIKFEESQSDVTLRRATWIIIVSAAVMRACLLPWPPDSSDVYRYVWDGRVQAAGINPYRYIPADPALASLRDNAVYPNINRADYAPTIYPPAAQVIFRTVGLGRGGVVAMKLVMVLFEGLTAASILYLLKRRGLPSTRVLLYAWSPLALYEFAGSGHIDAAAIALMMAAIMLADQGRRAASGALLAAATLTKFFPIVMAPALYCRWDWRAPLTALVVAVGLYLPFLSVGYKVFGFLSGYAHEEAIDDGTGFFVIGLLDQQIDLPSWARPAYLAIALAVLAVGAVATVWRRVPGKVDLGGTLFLLTAFTVFMSPHLPWYFTWTLPLLCFVRSWSVLYLTCAAPLLYWQAHAPDDPIYMIAVYLPFALLLIGEVAWRGVVRILERRRNVSFAV